MATMWIRTKTYSFEETPSASFWSQSEPRHLLRSPSVSVLWRDERLQHYSPVCRWSLKIIQRSCDIKVSPNLKTEQGICWKGVLTPYVNIYRTSQSKDLRAQDPAPQKCVSSIYHAKFDVKHILRDGHANPILNFRTDSSFTSTHLQSWAAPDKTFGVRQVTMLPVTPFPDLGPRRSLAIDWVFEATNNGDYDEVYNNLGVEVESGVDASLSRACFAPIAAAL